MPQSPYLLCHPSPHHTCSSESMRTCHSLVSSLESSLGSTKHAQEGEDSKNLCFFSLALCSWCSLWNLLFVQLLNPLSHPHLVGRGDPRYNYNSMVLQKQVVTYHREFILHVSATAVGIPAGSTQHLFAFRQHAHKWDLMYDPDTWEQLLLKTCSQLGDANPREAVLLLLTRLPNRPLPSHQSTQFKTSTSIPVQGYLFLPLLQSLLPLPRFQQISCESGHRKTHYLKRIWLSVKKFTGSFSSTLDNSKSYTVFNMNSTCFVP